MEKLTNKLALVVGGTGGIGSRTAKLLAQSGAKVLITGRDAAKLATVGSDAGIPTENQYALDVTDTNAIQQMADQVTHMHGTPDILIIASGIGIIKPMETLTTEDMMTSLMVNVMAPFALMKAFLPGMKERKTGLIINLPGVLGKAPMHGAAAYGASKYGLNGMVKSIREELKRTDIRMTNIYMGGVDSPFWDTIDLRVQRDKMISMDEAARSIWFLCQQPASGVVAEMVLQPFNHQVI